MAHFFLFPCLCDVGTRVPCSFRGCSQRLFHFGFRVFVGRASHVFLSPSLEFHRVPSVSSRFVCSVSPPCFSQPLLGGMLYIGRFAFRAHLHLYCSRFLHDTRT
ncbi:unnamed protein product, partial [Sphacelaria rigidula]